MTEIEREISKYDSFILLKFNSNRIKNIISIKVDKYNLN